MRDPWQSDASLENWLHSLDLAYSSEYGIDLLLAWCGELRINGMGVPYGLRLLEDSIRIGEIPRQHSM
jgi:hypothetical protein